jgi:hypothetical protein
LGRLHPGSNLKDPRKTPVVEAFERHCRATIGFDLPGSVPF